VSVRVIGNWLGLGFASKMPITGTRTGEKLLLCGQYQKAKEKHSKTPYFKGQAHLLVLH